ncbi:hypothetical protein [Kibdelosporangium aridum]|uniref:Uncharacterized protein n=1 Tax=Kibdelosporangium aridum TaxID=2030 RepID=A0A1Y5X2D9_KIBAR|nr:hypothetical protein [Kibdelosporangium aridum]SMC64657.1 hypothetical protein SAMN05661093_01144 [Kibdelosporangium aridum]
MTTPLTSNNIPSHGPARYRATAHGLQVVIPNRCPSGRHVLTSETCRIYETVDTLHITCPSCANDPKVESTWSLTTHGRTAQSAVFENLP